MNKLRYGLMTLAIFVFAACYEVNEEIVIDENGTGTYVTKMDMSALVEMMQMMAGEEELSRNGLDRPIDTSIRMKNLLDTAAGATEEQKRLFSNGTMNLQMNLKENVLKAEVNFPFNNYGDLQTLMSGSGAGGLAEVFKTMFAADSAAPATASDQSLDQVNQVFDVKVTKNSITRTLNQARYDSLMTKPEIVQARQMAGGSFEIMYTTTIHFPRAVKQCDNALIKFSNNKKTATFRYNLMEMLDTPDKFSYTIVY